MKFWAVFGATFVAIAVICGVEAPLGDSWNHWLHAHRTPFAWDGFLGTVRAAYESGNPRWGQIPLALSYRAAWIPALVSPLMIVGGFYLAAVVLRARWLVANRADTWLFVRVVAAAIATSPQVGAIWFYRPICTNYMYPLALHLLWIVPYRFLAARAPATRIGSLALAIAIVPLGAIAGAGNEHTGLALIAAALICMRVAWRRDRMLPLWSVTGLVALAAGYAFLLTAPGQQLRYGGIAQHASILEPVFTRGIGNVGILALLLAWASPMIIVVGIGARLARWSWSPGVRRQLIAYAVIGFVVFGTALLSPRLAPRLLLASSTVIALALGTIMIELDANERAARWLRRACATIVVAFFSVALVINVTTGIEGRARIAKLLAAPAATEVHVEPYTFAAPTPFSWGDDFRNPAIRERVRFRFDLEAITYD